MYTTFRLFWLGFRHYSPRTWFCIFPVRPFTILSRPSSTEHFSYWYRPHKSVKKDPIVFIHGIGVRVYSPAILYCFLTNIRSLDWFVCLYILPNRSVPLRPRCWDPVHRTPPYKHAYHFRTYSTPGDHARSHLYHHVKSRYPGRGIGRSFIRDCRRSSHDTATCGRRTLFFLSLKLET